jgi:hypothetical protein
MSGIKPLFVSAPRLVIRFNDTNVAYAVGISIDVSVDVKPVFTLGNFGALSYEPTMYQPVRGSMQLLKLIPQANPGAGSPSEAGAAAATLGSDLSAGAGVPFQTGAQAPYNASDAGWNALAAQAKSDNSLLKVDNTFRHLDPTTVLLSSSFDITMFLNVDHTLPTIQFMNITDCRLTGRSISMSMGQLLAEPVTFEGLLAQSSGFSADNLFKDGIR